MTTRRSRRREGKSTKWGTKGLDLFFRISLLYEIYCVLYWRYQRVRSKTSEYTMNIRDCKVNQNNLGFCCLPFTRDIISRADFTFCDRAKYLGLTNPFRGVYMGMLDFLDKLVMLGLVGVLENFPSPSK